MPPPSRFTPLRDLEFAVVDTETTSLDVASASVIEIGGVRGTLAALPLGETFHTLIDPGVPIPPASTALHHIDDARVQGAPRFAAIAQAFWDFVGAGRVLVGQSIGFDLAVLWHEMRRAGLAWPAPIFLDTKLLASALERAETELSFEELTRRFGITIGERHSALADARATAEVFARLVASLEAAGITTLGDAIARANAQHRTRARQIADGWYDSTFLRAEDGYASGGERSALARLAVADGFAYRHRLEHVLREAPLIVTPSLRLGDAMRTMDMCGLPALLVGDAAAQRADGLITERVVLETMAHLGPNGFDVKLESVMITPVEVLPKDAFIYRALGRMRRLGVSYLAVDDGNGHVVGLVSEQQLAIDPTTRASVLGDRLSAARSPAELADARVELLPLAAILRADGVDALEIADIASFELRELLGRAAALAEKRMESFEAGRPPVPYALLALDAAGRGECLLDSLPCSALVFESGDPRGLEDAWFAAFAAQLDEILGVAGVASASSPLRPSLETWRGSLAHWNARVAGWSLAAPPDAEAFFDGRWVCGDWTLARDLETLVVEQFDATPALRQRFVARALVQAAAAASVAAADESLDLRAAALAPLVGAARVLALRAGSRARATAERFAAARSAGMLAAAACDALVDAHATLFGLAVDAELAALAASRAARPLVRPAELGGAERARLVAALDQVRSLPAILAAAGLGPGTAG